MNRKTSCLLVVAFVMGIWLSNRAPELPQDYDPKNNSYANMPTYDDWPGSWEHQSNLARPSISEPQSLPQMTAADDVSPPGNGRQTSNRIARDERKSLLVGSIAEHLIPNRLYPGAPS